jgi:hypothetical protein
MMFWVFTLFDPVGHVMSCLSTDRMHQDYDLPSGDNLDFKLLGYDTVWFGRWYICCYEQDAEVHTAVKIGVVI